MSSVDALSVLKCYDKEAHIQFGTSGSFENDVSRFLSEIDKNGEYTNFIVWTRGEVAPCQTKSEDGTALSNTQKSDDQRFDAYIFSGVDAPSFHCFTTIRDQIVLRLGGPPTEMVVTGIWRFNQQKDNERVQLSSAMAALNQRYPALMLNADTDTSQGFYGVAFLDPQGKRLDWAQIGEDYQSLRPPIAPSPPKTTKSCGFLGFGTCDRQPTQAEYDEYNAAKRQYEDDLVSYQARSDLAQKYGVCVSNPPRAVVASPIRDDADTNCGPSMYVAATPYPGGFAEGLFIAVYDPVVARSARVKLEEYLRSRRAQSGSHGTSSELPI
jgi:hypothetical protein